MVFITNEKSSAPSHSLGANQAIRLQWHHAEAFQDLPLRAQFRICTGFPYSTTLIYILLKFCFDDSVKQILAAVLQEVQH